jgi:CBS domain containing-hemolysin-like protein
MDPESPVLYLLLISLILCGAYFAATETAYTSVNKIRLKLRAEDGDKRAIRALNISNRFEKALTTVLIGNNLAQIACAAIATLIATSLWGATSVPYTTAVVTVVVFFICEMLPKSFAKTHSEVFALGVSASLSFFMIILTPVTFIFSSIGNLFTKLMKSNEEPSVTEDELFDLIDTIEEDGSLDEDEVDLIRSALEFNNRTAQDILTSRVDLVSIDVDASPEEILSIISGNTFTRFPVYEGTIDTIIGIIHMRKYLREHIRAQESVNLRDLLDPPFMVHKSVTIDVLMKRMTENKVHMTVITDDYGGTMGVATMEDILEELVGEIWDEDDIIIEDFINLGENRFEVSGDLNCLDAFEEMGFTEFEKNDFRHRNMGAWALEQFDRFPYAGESFQFGTMNVTISEILNMRVTKLYVKVDFPKSAAFLDDWGEL